MDLLFTPLLYIIGHNLSEGSIMLSCVMTWWVTVPFFVIAGKQDAKRHCIDGVVLLTIHALTMLHALMFINVVVTLVCGVVAYLSFREKEISIIGQADFILLAHWIFSPFCYSTGTGLMVVESFVFLVCLLVYTKTYRDENGKPWHRGKMVPLFPPYTVTVCIMAVLSIPVGLYCYYVGL